MHLQCLGWMYKESYAELEAAGMAHKLHIDTFWMSLSAIIATVTTAVSVPYVFHMNCPDVHGQYKWIKSNQNHIY